MKYPIKELSIVEILSNSIRFSIDNFTFLAVLAGIWFLPRLAISLISETYSVTHENIGFAVWSGTMYLSHPPLSVAILNLFVFILTDTICTAAVAWSVTQRFLGFDISVRDCFLAVSSRIGRIFGASILSGLGIVFGSILCLIPGVYLALAWFILYPVLMYEDLRATEAMARSRNLMRGQKLRALAVIVITTAAALAVSLLFSIIPGLYFSIVASAAIATIVLVFNAAMASVMYVSARCCIEPISMETLIQTIEAARENDGFCSEHAPN
ncbi:MAG: hypothetical protein HZB26_10260 [Candidatus Hydrogenedentes bacterium]|nr:hypothetical protein [Candidatus Hydrogenedentota bacterium]